MQFEADGTDTDSTSKILSEILSEPETMNLIVTAPGGRLDSCVAELVPDFSRSRLQKLIDRKSVV